jgi:hypothetical protein
MLETAKGGAPQFANPSRTSRETKRKAHTLVVSRVVTAPGIAEATIGMNRSEAIVSMRVESQPWASLVSRGEKTQSKNSKKKFL